MYNLCLSIWLHLHVFHDVYSLSEISFNQFFRFAMIVSQISEASPTEFESSQFFLSKICRSILKVILEDYSESSSDVSDDISEDEDNPVDVFRLMFKTFDINADTVSLTTWLEVATMVFHTMLVESELLKFNPYIEEMKEAYQEYTSKRLQPKGKALLYILYSLCEMAIESSGVSEGVTKMLNNRREQVQEYLNFKDQEKKEKQEMQDNSEISNPNIKADSVPLTLTQTAFIHSLSLSLQEGNIERYRVDFLPTL